MTKGKKKSSATVIHTSLTATTPALSETVQTQVRKYGVQDLDSALVEKLRKEHPESHKALILAMDKELESGSQLSAKLLADARSKIGEFENMLTSFNSQEKLKNLEDEFFNAAYFQASYRLKIADLSLKLGDRKKAKKNLRLSLLQCSHSTIIKNYLFMLENNLVTEEIDHITYMLNIIKFHNESRGNRQQRVEDEYYYQQVAALFVEKIGENKNQILDNFANRIAAHYLKKKNYTEIEQFLIILNSTGLTRKATDILKIYLQNYLNQSQPSDLEEIDRILVQFKSLVSIEHYKIIYDYLFKKLFLGEPYLSYLQHYLEQGANLGDIKSQVQLASHLILNSNGNIQKVHKALEMIKKIQIAIKSKSKEFNPIRGTCFYLIGVVYDRGLLPEHPEYKPNAKLALDNFEWAIQYNNREACNDLAINYMLNIPQDLEKAAFYLEKAASLNPFSGFELARVQLMQAAKVAERREELLDTAISNINKVLSIETLKLSDTDVGSIHFYAALAYLFKDFGINYQCDHTGTVKEIVATELLSKPKYMQYVSVVLNHLEEGSAGGHICARFILAVLLQYGTYLKQDLKSAEAYYLSCISEEVPKLTVGLQLLELYLLQMSRATSIEERQKYLLKALHWNLELLKDADDETKTIFSEIFSQCIELFRNPLCTATQLEFIQNNYRDYRKSQKFELDLSKKIQSSLLNPTIDKIKTETAGLKLKISKESVSEFLKTLYDLSQILRKTKTEIPSYIAELSALADLELPLIEFPLPAQIALIINCSTWPFIQDTHGFISNLLVLIQSQHDINDSDKLPLILAITHFKQDNGLFEDCLVQLFFNKLDSIKTDNISRVALLLHIFAIIHANGSPNLTSRYKTPQVETKIAFLIDYLQEHCWEAKEESMSQIYNAINYLSKIYPGKLVFNEESPLGSFIKFYENLLSQKNAVTISHSQKNAFNLIQSLNKDFKHEPLVGGRRVDYYNPKTREVVFFHGPSHYLYSKEGIPVAKNAATVLNEKTLELQGYKIYAIPYHEWDDYATADRISFLENLIPSLKKSPLEEIKKSDLVRVHFPETKQSVIKPGQSSQSFWKRLDASSLNPHSPKAREAVSEKKKSYPKGEDASATASVPTTPLLSLTD